MLQSLRQASSSGLTRHPFRLQRRPEERVRVLGGSFDLVKSAEVFHFVGGKIAAGEKAIVANHNLHSLYLIRKDAELQAFFDRADLIEVDSIPLILWARLVGRPGRRFHRCTYLDWRDEFWARAKQDHWRVFFVGGKKGVGEKAAQVIRSDWPDVLLATHDGYFDSRPGSDENERVVQAIRAFKPDILFVGMGMPLQEKWILNNFANLPPCVMFTVGGAFDYEAGVQIAPPRWVGQLGLEWLARLCMDPRRLFNRYCVEPFSLAGPALHDLKVALRRKLSKSRDGNTSAHRG
jgi:N-acetylglucosaminyldiphosphoundecaprenol N-acetyl-beta-D-mannosaminyltransferase